MENNLKDSSRVWIYQSNQAFEAKDIPLIKVQVQNFAKNWVSHNRNLRSLGDVYYDRFIILMVDESQADASGCSIDSSVRFVKSIESNFNVNLFDRMAFSYEKDGAIHTVNNTDFAALYEKGEINDDTIVFNNLVKTKGELNNKWRIALKDSWHKRFV